MSDEEDFVDNNLDGDDDIEIVEDEEEDLHFSVEGLGQLHEIEGQKIFVKTDECIHCIHDIQVALRNENSTNGNDSRRIDKYLGQWQTLEKQLVPLFLHYREDTKIWTGVLKLLVIMTRPLNKNTSDIQIHLKYLQDYKNAMNMQDMFITLMSILMDAVSTNEKNETQIHEIETQIAQIDVIAREIPNADSGAHNVGNQDMIDTTTTEVIIDANETQQMAAAPSSPTSSNHKPSPQVNVEDPSPALQEIRRQEEEKRIRKEKKRLKEQKKGEIRHLTEISKVHEKNVELVLTLVRHLLEVPDPKPGDPGYTQARGSMQIQLIKHLSDEGVLDLLLMFAEQIEIPKYQHLNWLFLEVFYHICATIPPSEIANHDECLKVDLSKLLDIEKRLVYAQVPQYARHSRFASASVLKHVAPSCGGGFDKGFGLASGINPLVVQKAAKNKFYRERKLQVAGPDGQPAEAPSLFQDPAFIDISITSQQTLGSSMLPSSILGSDYRDFYAEIKNFIDQFLESVFGTLMKSVYSEIQNEKNLHDYDLVRVINMITWILDYQIKLGRKCSAGAAKSGIKLEHIAWAIGQDALSLIAKQVKLHSKESKTIKAGGANLIVALRALLEQIKLVKLLGAESGDAFTILDSLCYEEVPRALTWIIRNFKPTVNRPEVLWFSVECAEEFLKSIDEFIKKRELNARTESASSKNERMKSKAEKRQKRKISQQEAELQGIEFYNNGDSSDSDNASSDSDSERDYEGEESLVDTKAGIMADICHGEAIGNLFYVLQNYKDNPSSTNSAVCAAIMRIILENSGYVAYFFQLSYLVILFNIVNDPLLLAMDEERKRHYRVILIAKQIIRKFIQAAKVNKNIFVEILFPRTKVGKYGSLLSIESDLNSICNNYADEETRLILERIHQGDTYESLKAERREKSLYSTPWTEEEDQQLIGLWGQVSTLENRSKKDKINMIIANTVPMEGRKKRRVKEVYRRLIQLGQTEDTGDMDDDELNNYSEDYSNSDDDYAPNRNTGASSSSNSSSSSSEDSDAETAQRPKRMNFQEYVSRVNTIKISDRMKNIFDMILSQNGNGLSVQEREILGHDVLLKFAGLHMKWPKVNTQSKPPSFVSYTLTIVAFCVGVAIADIATPFVSYYFSMGEFPDSTSRTYIFDNLETNVWGMVLASIVGLVLLMVIIVSFQYGGFLSVLLIQIEETAAYLAVGLFVSWLIWKYNPTIDTTISTMTPFVMLQGTMFIVLEIAAIVGQGQRAGKPFVALGCLLGTFVGIIRSTESAFFYVDSMGNLIDNGASYGTAFGNSILDTLFFFGSTAIASTSIARSKMGGTFLWHLIGLILSIGLACAYSMCSSFADYVPMIESDPARYIVAALIVLATLMTAILIYRPIYMMPDRVLGVRKIPNAVVASHQRATGPIAANAVVLV